MFRPFCISDTVNMIIQKFENALEQQNMSKHIVDTEYVFDYDRQFDRVEYRISPTLPVYEAMHVYRVACRIIDDMDYITECVNATIESGDNKFDLYVSIELAKSIN